MFVKVMRVITVQAWFSSCGSNFKAIVDLHFLDSSKLAASQILRVLVVHHLTLLPCHTSTVLVSLRNLSGSLSGNPDSLPPLINNVNVSSLKSIDVT